MTTPILLLVAAAALCVGTKAAKAAQPASPSADVAFDVKSGKVTVSWQGKAIFVGTSKSATFNMRIEQSEHGLTQTLTLSGPKALTLTGQIDTGSDGLAAETLGAAQRAFRCIRTTVGRSASLRNNAVYSRSGDWMIEGPIGTRISPGKGDKWSFRVQGAKIELVFRPDYYRKHKNLSFFDPSHKVWKGSVTGWCSWWPYFADVDEKAIRDLVDVFGRKHLKDFGYRYIQIDDGFQTEPKGKPESWLQWQKSKFPSGIDGYVKMIREKGLEPGIWISSGVFDDSLAKEHPDWFVRSESGGVLKGPWVNYPLDASNPEALAALIEPLYKELKAKGFTYVKIDTLRHLLYDGYYHAAKGYFEKKGYSAETAFHAYLTAARRSLGDDSFLLACWGVLPEAVGIADGCRLGGDGYGPATMQQYNSWNGIVWRSDPDHCDILPRREYEGDVRDTVVRPVLASMAGAMLMISDKAEVYEKDENLEGVKRSAPVLFSVPGQLYDYDPRKSDALMAIKGHRQQSGGPAGPIDADQFGEGCEWWVQEIDRPFERWLAVARFSWDKAVPATTVAFKDLGLDPLKEYAVYEFWGRKFVGLFKGSFPAAAQEAKGVCVYAIREKLNRPQVLSTSRHISQGGVDLLAVKWSEESLSGRSEVVVGDRYELTLLVPKGFQATQATMAGNAAKVEADGELVRVSFTPAHSASVTWEVKFRR